MFDWEFFQETKLIEKYENMIIKIPGEYKINNQLQLQYKNDKCILYKSNDNTEIVLDFYKKLLTIQIPNQEKLHMPIYYTKIEESNNQIKISYQIDEQEQKNKLIITKKV